MKQTPKQSKSKRSEPMLHDDRRIFDHYPVSDTDLVNRINRALSGKGLRVQRTRPESSGAGVPAYEFIHASRTFGLRVSLDELARALGVLGEASEAELHVHARTRPCVCELR
jgi:hypothetical protein